MNTLSFTTEVGHVTLTRITPLRDDSVHLALTAFIPSDQVRTTPELLSLYASLLLTKTKKKSKAQLEAFLLSYGISLAITSSRDSITFTASVRAVHMNRLVDLLSMLIFEADIVEEEYRDKRTLAREANREAHDNAKRIAHINFTNVLYRGNPHEEVHTLEEERSYITKTTRAQITRVHEALPHSRWYLSIVGSEGAELEALRLARKLEYTSTEVPHTVRHALPRQREAVYETVKGKTNIEVLLGNTVPLSSDTDPSFIPFDFGIDVLGKVGGFSGRLMSTVREKEGLTYGIYAHTSPGTKGDSVHFVVRTFFMAKDYERGLQSTLREIRMIHEKGITGKELSTFKDILTNEAILARESHESRLRLFHGLVTHGRNEHDYLSAIERMKTLTQKEVNASLRALLNPDSLVLSAAGPIRKDGSPIITEKS